MKKTTKKQWIFNKYLHNPNKITTFAANLDK